MRRTRMKPCYRGLMFALLMFMGGCVGSCDVARLKLMGTETEATVTGFSRIDQKNASTRCVKYTWQSENGTQMTGYDKVAPSWSPPSSQKIRIRYLPKAKVRGNTYKSRLVENSADASLIMMGVGFVLTIACGAWTLRELKNATA